MGKLLKFGLTTLFNAGNLSESNSNTGFSGPEQLTSKRRTAKVSTSPPTIFSLKKKPAWSHWMGGPGRTVSLGMFGKEKSADKKSAVRVSQKLSFGLLELQTVS